MKKIIHLSDLHIGHEDCAANFRIITDNISRDMLPADDYIVVITGDIVDNANRSDQAGEAVDLLADLGEKGYKVLVIPGNHDYGTGTAGNKEFVSLFKERFYLNREITYPKLDIIEDIAFIGLDSTAEELHWNDRFLSQGELGREQLTRLNDILNIPELKGKKKVVYLHHHPFDYIFGMQLRDRKALKKVIAGRIDILLFGHYHSFGATAGKNFNGKWSIPRCYNAGSSTHKNGDNGFHRVINPYDTVTGNDYDGKFL